MNLQVQPSINLQGTVRTPPNKSHYFRALILAALAEGTSHIRNVVATKDWQRGVEAVTMLGAKVMEQMDGYEVIGNGQRIMQPKEVIDCGNSGILLRFLMGVAAGGEGYAVLSGDESIKTLRPVSEIIKGLTDLSCLVQCLESPDHAPLMVKGPIQGGKTTVNGSDSQTVSGLLIAAALAPNTSEIFVTEPGEKPWVDVTLSWLKRAGIECENVGNTYEHYKILGGQKLQPFEVTIPNDWSAALYPIVAALITPGSEITILGLDPNDVQGDKHAVEVLQKMGGDIEILPDRVVARHSLLHGIEIDCNDFIDQFLIMAVAGAFASGETKLCNAEICRRKECDRITAMREGLQKMGVKVEELPDGLVIQGGERLRGVNINGYKDHRVVMSFAVAGLAAVGETVISDAEAVEKSFKDFVPQMVQSGAGLSLSEN